MIYYPRDEKPLIGFELVLHNNPGTLNKILTLIAEQNLNIEYIETCFTLEDQTGIFIVVNFKESKASPKDLLKTLRKMKNYVIKANIAPTFKNIIYPSSLCIKELGGIRAVLLSNEVLGAMIEGIKEELGEELWDTFLFRQGYIMGRKIYELFAKPIGIKDFEEGIELLNALGRSSGGGEIVGYNIEKDRKIILKVNRLFECELYKGRIDKPISYFSRGVFIGFFRELLGKKLDIRETKCIALGDQYCEFEIIFRD